jgi:hypothetical protein
VGSPQGKKESQHREAVMTFCERCGSTSRDKDGFCGGCGAPWPSETVASELKPSQGSKKSNSQISPLSRLTLPAASISADPRFFGINEIQPKRIWVAVPLAVMFGPVGLLYCTMTGTIVMTIASIILWWVAGNLSYVLVPAICAFWAWRAARQSPSILD